MKQLFLFLSILFFISCNSIDEMNTTCRTNSPLEDLVWLKEIKTTFEQSTSAQKKKIIQYTYKNETVFLINTCVGCADNLTTMYNCKGEKICEFGGIAGVNTCTDFDESKANKKILWEN